MSALKATAACVLLALLAGCATSHVPATTPVLTGSATTPSGNALQPVTGTATSGLTGLKEFAWEVRSDTPELVLEVAVGFGKGNECHFDDGAMASPKAAGPAFVTVLESGDLVSWSVASSGHLVSAHAAGFDTRTLQPGTPGVGLKSFMTGTFTGDWNWTFVGHDLVAGNDFLGGAAVAFAIACKDPFDILGARFGQAQVLLDERNLQGGTGANVALVGTAGLGDTAHRIIESPRVRAMAGGRADYAQVTVQHPGGAERWDWSPITAGTQTREALLQPGDIRIRVDEAATSSGLWVGAWGTDTLLDLRAGQVAKSPLEPGFTGEP